MNTSGLLIYRYIEMITSSLHINVTKELYILTEMETFAEEPEFGKLLRELKSTPVWC